MRTERAAPRAALLIESMRDIGYALETALADIIDNSITAGAANIRMFAETTGREPRIGILDDGRGMGALELLDAMRLGTRSPLDDRDASDLGRFGLGLKTASFSQCRRLTIVARKSGTTTCARWDLDYVVKEDDWLVQLPTDTSGIPWVELLGPKGTLVVWENLDRIADSTDEGRQYLIRKLDEAAEHLSLVFHRYLSGEKGLKRVKLSLNNRELEPFDPFHSGHSATDAMPPEKIRIGGHEVTIQAFTLPHHQKVSAAVWERYAGRAGYIKNQGFYLYRAKRVIIHGTWFGLARQMELTKLARVRIDMPNDLDVEWKVDVKKASAHPPRQVRERLRKLVESIGAASVRVYTTRGRKLVSDTQLPVWSRSQNKSCISYRLNPDHPAMSSFMGRLADDTRADFLKILEMAGSSLPVDALFADMSGHPELVTGGEMSTEALKHIVTATFTQLKQAGISGENILDMMKAAEPFRSRWELTEGIARQIMEKTSNV